MLAQFSTWPLDKPHMSQDMAEVSNILDEAGIRYEIGPMATTLEGEWDELLSAVRACHEKLRNDHQRVLTTITIDDDATRALNMSEASAKVAAQRKASES